MIDLATYSEAIDRATTVEDVRALRILLAEELEDSWEAWLDYLFPSYVTAGFAPHHVEFWTWLWAIEAGKRQRPFIGIWSRSGAKSTSVEMGTVALGARARRHYGLVVSDTQDQADDRVGNIGTMLESARLGELYPAMADRLMGKFGNSRGWRRNRLRTASGFTVDAIGLDTAARGVKLDEDRPDFIVFDDIDDATDSPKVTQRKIDQLTRTILPAQAEHAVVLGMQNLVIPNGIFARIAGRADQPADFLQDRILSGPIPAVRDLELAKDDEGKDIVIGGEPTWEGQGLERVQFQILDWGRTAFLIEAQHEVELRSGGKFSAWDWMEDQWRDDNMRHDVQRCRAWDQAGTEFDGKNDPDWTVGVRWAYDGETKLYRIEDVVRFRHSAGARDEIMRSVATEDANEFGLDRVAQLIERRPGDLGRDEADRIVREVFQGFRAAKISPIGSKDERADGLASGMENRLVTIRRQEADPAKNRTGSRAFLAECEAFPLGDHDDQVDAAAHGFNWLRKAAGSEGGTSAAALTTMRPLRRR